MKKMFFLSALLFAPLLFAAEQKVEKSEVKTSNEPTIRVVIADSVPSVILESNGPYSVINKETGELLSLGSLGKRYAVYMLKEGLRWGEEFVDIYSIQVTPKGDDPMLYVDGMQYKGAVTLYGREDGTLLVVNEVPLEDYVKSTLSAQINNVLSKEALAAMAISARTVAYKSVLENKNNLYDVTARETAYFGHGVTKKKSNVESAVEATCHIVMSGDGKVPTRIPLNVEEASSLASQGLNAKEILKKVGGKELLNTTSGKVDTTR